MLLQYTIVLKLFLLFKPTQKPDLCITMLLSIWLRLFYILCTIKCYLCVLGLVQAKSWHRCVTRSMELTQIYRQNDRQFIAALQNIRIGR